MLNRMINGGLVKNLELEILEILASVKCLVKFSDVIRELVTS